MRRGDEPQTRLRIAGPAHQKEPITGPVQATLAAQDDPQAATRMGVAGDHGAG